MKDLKTVRRLGFELRLASGDVVPMLIRIKAMPVDLRRKERAYALMIAPATRVQKKLPVSIKNLKSEQVFSCWEDAVEEVLLLTGREIAEKLKKPA
jgi:hypothetical protein